MEFSEKLKELRSKKGISQATLASDIHISRSAVAKWENGLGMPNDESLKMLANYFEVAVEELIPNKNNEAILVSKNKTIERQKKIILSFALGCIIGLFLLAFIFIEPLREALELLGIGTILTALGVFNMCGNIGSIHWYNRRKVAKENQKIYCLIVGLGTLIIGVAIIIAGIIQSFIGVEPRASFVMVGGILVGLALILYAQFKYNRGLF